MRAASQRTTLLTSVMLTLPICRSGTWPGWSFHSASSASPTFGQREQRLVVLGLGEQVGAPGLQVEDDVHAGGGGLGAPRAAASDTGVS